MKQITLIILFLVTGQFLIAQTVITNDYNLSLGDTYRYNGYEEVSNIEPGSSGPNQTWDFSQVTGSFFIEGDENICVDPSTTPFADSAAIAGANICVRNVDEDISPYQYFDCGNNQMDLLAMGFVNESNASFSTYTNALTAMNYPFGYGDDFDDTWELITFHIDFGFYMMRDSAAVLIESDAYGTITTPFGTFQNSLRIKRTTTYYSWFRFQAGDDWVLNGPFTDITYEWYAPSVKVPVMIIDEMDGFPDYSVRYLVDHNFVTAIHEVHQNQIDIYPNPASSTIHLNGSSPILHISVYSAQGRKVLNTELPINSQQQIEIGKLAQGMYVIVVGYEDGTTTRRKFLKK